MPVFVHGHKNQFQSLNALVVGRAAFRIIATVVTGADQLLYTGHRGCQQQILLKLIQQGLKPRNFRLIDGDILFFNEFVNLAAFVKKTINRHNTGRNDTHQHQGNHQPGSEGKISAERFKFHIVLLGGCEIPPTFFRLILDL